MYRSEGVRISDDEIRIVVPLTLGLNQINRMHRAPRGHWAHSKYCANQSAGVVASLRQIFGLRIPKPWAQRVELRAIRCSDTNRYMDSTNVRGGMKETEDAIVKIGLIHDDSPKYVTWAGDPEQRPLGKWGDLDGPATYIYIRRLA